MHNVYLLLLAVALTPMMIALGQTGSGGWTTNPSTGGMGVGSAAGPNEAARNEAAREEPPRESVQSKDGHCNVMVFDEKHVRGICGEQYMKEVRAQDEAALQKQRAAILQEEAARMEKVNALSQIRAPGGLRLDQLMGGARLELAAFIPLAAESSQTRFEVKQGQGSHACTLKHGVNPKPVFLRPSVYSESKDGTLSLGTPVPLAEDGSWVRVAIFNNKSLSEIECKNSDGKPVTVRDVTQILGLAMAKFTSEDDSDATTSNPLPAGATIFLPPEQTVRNSPAVHPGTDKPELGGPLVPGDKKQRPSGEQAL